MRFHCKRGETRCGDELVREWVMKQGSIANSERAARLSTGHLRMWLHNPERGLQPDNARKVALAAGLPFEAIVFRWKPVKDLDFWRWVRQATGKTAG